MTASVPVVRTIWRLLWKCLCFPRKLDSIPSELAPQKAEEQNNCLSLPQPPHSTVGQWVRLGQCAKSKTPRTWPLVIPGLDSALNPVISFSLPSTAAVEICGDLKTTLVRSWQEWKLLIYDWHHATNLEAHSHNLRKSTHFSKTCSSFSAH